MAHFKKSLHKQSLILLTLLVSFSSLAPVFLSPVKARPATEILLPENSIASSLSPESQENFLSPDVSQPEVVAQEVETTPTDLPEDLLTLPTDLALQSEEATTETGDSFNSIDGLFKVLQPQKFAVNNNAQAEVIESTGAFVYSYDFKLPKGRGGLQPELQLNYSSQRQGRGSLYGNGWEINFPSIERSAKLGVNNIYSANDFVLNFAGGGNLIPLDVDVNGYGTYGAEVESAFNKVEFLAEDFWQVTTKTGVIYTFGQTAVSRQDDPNDATRIFRWYLQSVEDTNGNIIDYQYWKDSGQIYPKEISYSDDATENSIFTVRFEPIYSNSLTERTDITTDHSAGFLIVTRYLVDQIDLLVNNTLTKRFELNITPDSSKVSILTGVQEIGFKDGENFSAPTVTFDYNQPAKQWTEDLSISVPYEFFTAADRNDLNLYTFATLPIDVNGDSLVDLIYSSDDPTDGVVEHTYLNTGSGWQLTADWQLPFDWTLRKRTSTRIMNYQKRFIVADANGDGRQDFVVSYKEGSTEYKKVYLNNGVNGWTLDPNWTVPFIFVVYDSYGNEIYDYTPKFTSADINGDRLVDLLMSYYTYGAEIPETRKVYINNGINGWNRNYDWNLTFDFSQWLSDNVLKFDFRLRYRMMDVDGDGLTDFVRSYIDYSNGQVERVSINNGVNGWVYDPNWKVPIRFSYWNSLMVPEDYGIRFKIIDLNNDGLDDFVESYYHYYEPEGYEKRTYINNGKNGWAEDSSYQIPFEFARYYNNSSPTDYNPRYRMFDAVGTGGTSYVISYNSDAPINPESENAVYNLSNPIAGGKLNQIKVNNRPVVQLNYEASAAAKDAGGDLLNSELPLNVPTVKSIENLDGLGGSQTTSYSYSSGSFYRDTDRTKNRFAGFGKVERQIGNTEVTTYYHQGGGFDGSSLGETADTFVKIGQTYRAEVRDNDVLKQQSITTIEQADLTNGQSFVRPVKTVSTSFDQTAKSVAQEFVYDNTTGNITQEINLGEVSADPNSGSYTNIPGDEKTTDYQYAVNEVKNILAAPKNKTISDSADSKGQDYYYDNLPLGQVNKVNVTKEDLKVNGVDVETTYNSFGNPLTRKDPKENTVATLTYDSNQLYPVESADALSNISETIYDPATGQLLYSRDANGYVEQNTLDAFGRLIKKEVSNPNNPASLITKQEIVYEDLAFPTYKQAQDYFDTNKFVLSREYYDNLGRVIQKKQSSGQTGEFITSATQYDSQGRVVKESLPYITSSIDYDSSPDFTYAKQYIYDGLNRVLSEITPTGMTQYSYDGLTTTITDSRGKVKKLTKDTYGNLAKVEEFNNSEQYITQYEYSLTNKLTKITDSQGGLRNFVYDDLDNLIEQDMVHRSSVTNPVKWIYTYDKNGNVLTKTDPKGQVTSYTYDNLNRVLTEDSASITGVEYTYTYDLGIGQKNRLSKVQGSDGVITEYTYDYAGKPITVERTVDGQVFIFSYIYDWNGNVQSITYPQGETVNYTYNDAGQIKKLERTKGGDTVILADNIEYSPLGQIEHIARANGAITDYLYDIAQNYRLTNLITDKDGTKLQDIVYTYDPNGNILSLTDNSTTELAKQVNYTYDDLNRLASATVSNAASGVNYTRSFSYDSVGNILNQSGVGAYEYTKDNPHQVSAVAGTQYTYDANGNVRYINNNLHEWDWRDRMSRSRLGNDFSTYYVYDHNNQRVKKATEITPPPPPSKPCGKKCPIPEVPQSPEGISQSGVVSMVSINPATTQVTYYVDKYFEKNQDGDITNHYFIGDLPIAFEISEDGVSSIYFNLTDHLGSNSVTLDDQGLVKRAVDYYPFGASSYQNTQGTMNLPYYFLTKELDQVSDLTYLNNRYYNQQTGKFISIDPYILNVDNLRKLLEDPQRLNSYLYSRNNPIILFDPGGLSDQEYMKGLFVGTGYGALNIVVGTAQTIIHPIDTTKSIGNLMKEGYNAGKDLSTDYNNNRDQTMNEIKTGLSMQFNEFMNQSDYDKGKAVGEAAVYTFVAAQGLAKSTGLEGYSVKNSIGIKGDRYAVSGDFMSGAKGVGLSLRDLSKSTKYRDTRLINIDFHRIHINGQGIYLPHIDLGAIKHIPWKQIEDLITKMK